jgi:glutamate/aspartate transport system substrate-binding protein
MRFGYLLALLAASACSTFAQAEGVLDRVRGGGPLVIAHRESSVPFSYVYEGRAVGYAVDLCLRIAEVVRQKTGRRDMPVQMLQVTPSNRIEAVKSGKADMECGSTTNTAERRKDVAFTIPHFITGARLLVPAASKVERMEDLEGRKLVSTQGTTPLKAAEQANRERLMRIQMVEAPDHEAAVRMVEKGEADAFVMDDVLLYGLASNRADPQALKVVGRFVTTEPLAIMLPYLLRDFWKYPSDEVPF